MFNKFLLIFIFISVITYISSETVTDEQISLVWQKCSAGLSGKNCEKGKATKMTWDKAVKYCQSLKIGGNIGNKMWRLPSSAEFQTLEVKPEINLCIDESKFPNTASDYYWTNDLREEKTADVWMVGFFEAFSSSYANKNRTFYVRCVAAPID